MITAYINVLTGNSGFWEEAKTTKWRLPKDSTLLRSAEQSETLMLGDLIKTLWLRIRYQFPQSGDSKLETRSSCGVKVVSPRMKAVVTLHNQLMTGKSQLYCLKMSYFACMYFGEVG